MNEAFLTERSESKNISAGCFSHFPAGRYIMIFRNDVGDYDKQKLDGDELKNFLDEFYGALGE